MVDTLPELDYVHVVQRMGVSVGDAEDVDEYPDFVPVTSGTVTIVPTLEHVRVAIGDRPVSVFNAAITCTIDPQGYLSYNGVRGVWLVDLGSSKIIPPVPRDQAAYVVTYSGLKFGTQTFTQRPVQINPETSTELDLTDAAALPLPAGVTLEYVQGIADQGVAAAASITELRGVASGYAALNADGLVIDAAGNVVGAVSSVNTKTGAVVLTAADVDALPDTYTPDLSAYTKTSDLPAAPTWTTISGKPAVVAAGTSQTAARAAIGAGTSSLVLGAGSTTALAGNTTAAAIGGATTVQGTKADSAVQPAALTSYVPTTRTVAGKALTGNVTLDADDVSALPVSLASGASAAVFAGIGASLPATGTQGDLFVVVAP